MQGVAIMSVVTIASQASNDTNSKRSVMKWWLEPRSKDRDEAFRERTIRITVALVIILSLLSFILTVVVYKNKWDIISLPTLHIFMLAGFSLSAYLVSYERIL